MLETPRDDRRFSRRTALQAGSAGAVALGAGVGSVEAAVAKSKKPKSVIFVFLTGGISHHDSFDMKPLASEKVRGEFKPIATKVPGIPVCEHLPKLAARADRYSLVRSMSTNSNGHEVACHMLLTGRLDLPAGFSTRKVPSPNEWPSIPSVITYAKRNEKTHLPPAVILPQPSVNEAARFRPGQYAGKLGPKYEAWHIDIAANCPLGNGACPDCFRFDDDHFDHSAKTIFNTPTLTLPNGGNNRLSNRLGLLKRIERQRRDLSKVTGGRKFDENRMQALSVLTDPKTSKAFDVENADPKIVRKYGKNKFGLSLLMARQLSEAGVPFVQVNLGKNSSWDTHRRNFINLKRNLFPHFDRCVSALMDDLRDRGLLDDTLVIVSGEFGRTPKINKNNGRDHWGPVFTSLFFGGGVKKGHIIGASDRIGAYPTDDKQTPENLAATMYDALGIPHDAQWVDFDGRPHEIYRAKPIAGLMA